MLLPFPSSCAAIGGGYYVREAAMSLSKLKETVFFLDKTLPNQYSTISSFFFSNKAFPFHELSPFFPNNVSMLL